MDNLIWTRRTRSAAGVQMSVHQGETTLATETMAGKNTPAMLSIDGVAWNLSTSPAGVTMSNGEGRQLSAHPEGKAKLGRAERIVVDDGSHRLRLINEYSTNWVVEDSEGVKIGQFTGFHSGVRDVEVDLSECPADRHPSRESLVLVAWLAKYVLERKLEVRSTIFIAVLAILTVVALLVFLL